MTSQKGPTYATFGSSPTTNTCAQTLTAHRKLVFAVKQSTIFPSVILVKPCSRHFSTRLKWVNFPAVLEKEKEKLKDELHNMKEASIIFDGTVLLGEVLAIVLRFYEGRLQVYETPCELRGSR